MMGLISFLTRRPFKAALSGAAFMALGACVSSIDASQPNLDLQPLATRNAKAEQTVRAFTDAYNDGDLDGMMALAANDIVWLDVNGDELSIATRNADELRAAMTSFFAGDATPKSAVAILTSHGQFVTTLERAYYTVDGKETSQASFAVYELKADKIRRVWYYPAQK